MMLVRSGEKEAQAVLSPRLINPDDTAYSPVKGIVTAPKDSINSLND